MAASQRHQSQEIYQLATIIEDKKTKTEVKNINILE